MKIETENQKILRRYGKTPDADGRYWFSDPRKTHNEDDAIMIAASCRLLGVPLTDTVTSEAWFVIVSRIAALERRLDDRE